ncbi:DUF1553 domain-containing protein [Flagellimonas aequoris]|uniref:DUF1553 domain-containing protein n=1 Tax=Flagellimonas aequoris TaxID=2306997 RepID=A0A418N8R5_9FLAO|nr:DUF1553 domain-containing protein [Allomuricauda aequoris]RIV71541.1 DUF1553 domain-containing protein [Allomuricauda aequoris]TXK03106.1 DUF1553 domain-containing protein [Allomuricauda aequoris]
MKVILRLCISFCLILSVSCHNYKTEELVSVEQSIPDLIDYNFHVRPILSDKCFACHGPDKSKQEAGLRLDIREEALNELKQTPGNYAIVPGKPGKSVVFERIMSADPEMVMPPIESHLELTSREKAILAKWIDQGAEYEEHWAFQLPKKQPVPDIKYPGEAYNEIDHFVLKKLRDEGLEFSLTANKENLLRRLSFDLTGLPPTLKELDQFISGQKSYEDMVDHYLASDSYGEKMATAWLDLARYADTHGYQDDGPRRMWPWRDWVINAYNDNMPYDQFIKWQLAGDKYPNPTLEQMIATGFNRNHLINVEGGIIAEEYRVEYVLDRTNTFGKAFLGLSFECARCHDHKYDPISQKDYYSTSYFFNSVDEMGQGQRDFPEVQPPSVLLTTEEKDKVLLFLKNQTEESRKSLENIALSSAGDFKGWVNKVNLKDLFNAPLVEPVESYPFEDSKEFKSIEGIEGRAVLFDGGGGLSFPGKMDFERYDPFSYSFHIKPPEPNGTFNFFTKSTGEFGGFRGIEMQLVDNRLELRMSHRYPNNAIRVRSCDPLLPEQWAHVGVTYDGSSEAKGIRIFINGKLQEFEVLRDNLYKSIVPYLNNSNGTYGIVFGYQFNAQGFPNGALDEFKIFDVELSQFEMNLLAKNNDYKEQLMALPKENLKQNEQLKEFYLLRKSKEMETEREQLALARKAENDTLSGIPEIMVMKDIQDSVRTTYVLERGNYDSHGEQVGPGLPDALMSTSVVQPKTRMELAEWVVSKENPLTSRVVVNRLWQSLFGRGLVETSNDFGSQGSLPTHPELLDWLAIDFIESGWDVKRMIKQIVMSKTYQQSSKASPELLDKDPNNELLARGPKYRLPAEMIRDNILAASGLLVEKIGGPSVKPYQPEGLWQEKASFVGENKYVRGTGDDLYRRSLYTYWRRTIPPPSMITFDVPDRNMCTVRRQSTTTPLQPLIMLNGPEYMEAAKVLASRVAESEHENVENQITRAFRLLTSRLPKEEELETLLELYTKEKSRFEQESEEMSQLLDIGDYKLDTKEQNANIAALTVVNNIIMNFDPVYTKY